jgi:hypothetical protein
MEPAEGRAGGEARGRRMSPSGTDFFEDFMSGFKDIGSFASFSAVGIMTASPL